MHLVVLERPAEHDADLAPGGDAALHLLLDDARWRMYADVLRSLVPVKGRKAPQVALYERLHGCEIEAPDEDEGEAARIGEAILVEGERLVEAHLREACRRERLRPQVVLAQCGIEGLVEHRVRHDQL